MKVFPVTGEIYGAMFHESSVFGVATGARPPREGHNTILALPLVATRQDPVNYRLSNGSGVNILNLIKT